MPSDEPLGLGLIGCGSFGRFCLEAFSRMGDVRIVAVADTAADAARAAAAPYDAAVEADPAGLIGRDDVDIVHVATPPASHHELTLAALRAGKHVLCEKPPAMSAAQADEVLAAAERAQRLAPVNFVLRYNQVTDAAKRVIDSGALGEVLYARLTNCAFDTFLPPGHWFWRRDLSGGIFIEHGVHFFDLYRYWLGEGQVLAAHTEVREAPRTPAMEDRALCVVRHSGGALVTHYHGFDQIEPMDRADHRLVCELGDIRVRGWIPLTLEIDAAVNDEGAERLAACCPQASIETVETYDTQAGPMLGRGSSRDVTRRVRLTHTPEPDKPSVYADSIRALLADQIAHIRDRSRPRRITEANGRAALALAEQAAKLAAAR